MMNAGADGGQGWITVPAVAVFVIAICLSVPVGAQTAEELVARNIQAKGGLEKIKAVNTLRMTGTAYSNGRNADVSIERKRPDMVRQNVTRQRMMRVQAYDGKVGWQISPFRGDKTPQLTGEDETRGLADVADIDGPLVDYTSKGNKVEYLGHDTVDGDDVYKLKVTLKNGDIMYYYLDPETCLEVRRERQEFVRGNVKETVEDMGSYKQVAGVYYASSLETAVKGNPREHTRLDFGKIEVNVPIDDTEFEMQSASK